MRVLVTGSRGFVGNCLVEELKMKGFEVKEFDLVLGNDLLDAKQCEEAAKGSDIVFHIAAIIDETNPKMQAINVEGTRNIAEASAKARAKQFIFMSSVGVHGKVKGIVNENSAILPETRYEQSKADAEKIVLDFQEMMHITVLRSAFVMGPKSREWAGIIKMVSSGNPIPGSGKNFFQTIFVKDLVSALVFAANNSNCFGETFIVAGKEKPTLREFVELIRKKTGVHGELKSVPEGIVKTAGFFNMLKNRATGKKSLFEPAYIGRILHDRNYDTSKINKLGWTPKYSLEKALDETIAGLKGD
ncbi:MAG: NAD-dependent epimerase/dehydratase family protein [Candidatus ainarchaeum sp.]|nr:NAD-dependent epimerase/dehydratase family protein [Candidatus ainarchaeum sp.]